MIPLACNTYSAFKAALFLMQDEAVTLPEQHHSAGELIPGMMVQRLKELQETGAREKDNLDRLQDLCISLEQDREAFKGSLDRAEKLHKNLHSRCSSTLQAGQRHTSCTAGSFSAFLCLHLACVRIGTAGIHGGWTGSA